MSHCLMLHVLAVARPIAQHCNDRKRGHSTELHQENATCTRHPPWQHTELADALSGLLHVGRP